MSQALEAIKSARPRTAIKPPTPKTPLIDTSKMSPSMGMMADIVNNTAAPFQEDPDPKRGLAGKIEHKIGAVMGIVGAPFELLDTGFALVTAPLAALMPGFPAAVLFMPHLGTMHGHAHPPSLIPPNPVPTPLPSIGTVLTAGCVSVLIGGVPAARAGDLGLAITCFSFGPPFEIYTGSSNTWIGGSRAARMLDITRHCNPASKLGLLGAAMGAVGVVAGAVGSEASDNAGEALQASMQAAQAAADAVALTMSALIGIDPGVPPSIGAVMLGNPTVLIGGFPVPDLLDLLGAGLKGLKKLGDKIGKSPTFKKLIAKVGLCNDKGEPVSSFTGAVYNDFDDYRAPSGFSWERHYKSSWNLDDGPLGYGFRHFFDRRLELLRTRAVYETHDGAGNMRRFQFDAEGNTIAEQDAAGNWTRSSYSSWNLLSHRTSALGHGTRFEHTHRGEWRALIDPNGNCTEYVRDQLHRVVEIRRYGRLYRRYLRNAHDVVDEEQDSNGNTLIRYETGPHGLHVAAALASGERYSYAYDARGRFTLASSTQHQVVRGYVGDRLELDLRDDREEWYPRRIRGCRDWREPKRCRKTRYPTRSRQRDCTSVP